MRLWGEMQEFWSAVIVCAGTPGVSSRMTSMCSAWKPCAFVADSSFALVPATKPTASQSSSGGFSRSLRFWSSPLPNLEKSKPISFQICKLNCFSFGAVVITIESVKHSRNQNVRQAARYVFPTPVPDSTPTHFHCAMSDKMLTKGFGVPSQ